MTRMNWRNLALGTTAAEVVAFGFIGGVAWVFGRWVWVGR
jgi:hypothetical protein